MTTPYHRIGRNAHRLPAGYFADAQDHAISAAPENHRRSEQSGAEHREVSGESGAAVHFGATETASSGGSQATQAHTPADTHAAASTSSPAVGTVGVVVHGAGGGERSHAAGNACLNCNDAHRLRAARILDQ